MALEGLRSAAPAAASAPARGRPAEGADGAGGTGFGAALAACRRDDAAPVTHEDEAEGETRIAADTATPAKDGAVTTTAAAVPAVEAPTGDPAWLPPSAGLPTPVAALPPPAPPSVAPRGAGPLPAARGAAASIATAPTAATVATAAANALPDAAFPSTPSTTDSTPALPPATTLLLQQQRMAQRDAATAAAAAAEPSTRGATAALTQNAAAEFQTLPGMALLSAEAQGLPRRWERASTAAGPVAGTGPAPATGADASAPSAFMAPVDAASAGVSPGHAGLAERMTEQVSWWLAQKTQNAELSVAIDGRPVSVSVKLQGNEAQVVFRSDQPEARQMLAQALPQLKEMFGNEGLLLSQASVGSQAQRDPAEGDQAARQQATRVTGAGAVAGDGAVPAAALRPRAPLLRADGSRPLDLYV